MTPDEAFDAAGRLTTALQSKGVTCEQWPLGVRVACGDGHLFVLTHRMARVHRWYEDAVPVGHTVTDPHGAATKIHHYVSRQPADLTAGAT